MQDSERANADRHDLRVQGTIKVGQAALRRRLKMHNQKTQPPPRPNQLLLERNRSSYAFGVEDGQQHLRERRCLRTMTATSECPLKSQGHYQEKILQMMQVWRKNHLD